MEKQLLFLLDWDLRVAESELEGCFEGLLAVNEGKELREGVRKMAVERVSRRKINTTQALPTPQPDEEPADAPDSPSDLLVAQLSSTHISRSTVDPYHPTHHANASIQQQRPFVLCPVPSTAYRRTNATISNKSSVIYQQSPVSPTPRADNANGANLTRQSRILTQKRSDGSRIISQISASGSAASLASRTTGFLGKIWNGTGGKDYLPI
jgi:hypothetical protein